MNNKHSAAAQSHCRRILMKLIDSKNDTVTLLLAREEFHLLRDTASAAIQGLGATLARYQRLAEKLQGMSEEEVYVYEALIEEDLNADSLDELQTETKQEQKLLAQEAVFGKRMPKRCTRIRPTEAAWDPARWTRTRSNSAEPLPSRLRAKAKNKPLRLRLPNRLYWFGKAFEPLQLFLNQLQRDLVAGDLVGQKA